jgi:hypothetical protein
MMLEYDATHIKTLCSSRHEFTGGELSIHYQRGESGCLDRLGGGRIDPYVNLAPHCDMNDYDLGAIAWRCRFVAICLFEDEEAVFVLHPFRCDSPFRCVAGIRQTAHAKNLVRSQASVKWPCEFS